MFTYEGPGPSGRSTVAVRVLPASVARMVIGPEDETRDTHRILLALFGSGGACSASGVVQRMATMLPAAAITCGMAMSGGVNPDRAQTGSGLTGGCPAQPLALAGEIGARGGCAADGCVCRGCCGELPLHAAATSETATAASAATNRHLISRRYAGHGAAPSDWRFDVGLSVAAGVLRSAAACRSCVCKDNKPKAAAAARIGAALGRRKRAELLALLRPCFARAEPWLQAGRYAAAMMCDLRRRNGWTIAERSGDRAPDQTQRLLNRQSGTSDHRRALHRTR
jgi:hypothetical protein